ncbi:MAG: SDR family NAD(P)-dependent oxidoreductase [Pirellulales bacterium]|nr:SDR family NAD(P)-dependent oxidoreductase [Pirellulales bacterium]
MVEHLAGNHPRHALITGAGGGLGRALAEQLARRGWLIALADVDEASAAATLARVNACGGQGFCVHLDVTRAEQWDALRRQLQEAWPTLDLLVNAAGVVGTGEVGRFSIADWDWVLETNLKGTILGCHIFVDWLRHNPHGSHIINTASAAGLASLPTLAAYNVSKAGVIALSETLHAELKAAGVGVTVLCPSFFSTGLLERGRFDTPQQRLAAQNTMARAQLTAEDVARAALRAMQHKQLYVVLPARMRFYWRLKRLLPDLVARYIARKYAEGVPEHL